MLKLVYCSLHFLLLQMCGRLKQYRPVVSVEHYIEVGTFTSPDAR